MAARGGGAAIMAASAVHVASRDASDGELASRAALHSLAAVVRRMERRLRLLEKRRGCNSSAETPQEAGGGAARAPSGDVAPRDAVTEAASQGQQFMMFVGARDELLGIAVGLQARRCDEALEHLARSCTGIHTCAVSTSGADASSSDEQQQPQHFDIDSEAGSAVLADSANGPVSSDGVDGRCGVADGHVHEGALHGWYEWYADQPPVPVLAPPEEGSETKMANGKGSMPAPDLVDSRARDVAADAAAECRLPRRNRLRNRRAPRGNQGGDHNAEEVHQALRHGADGRARLLADTSDESEEEALRQAAARMERLRGRGDAIRAMRPR